MNDASVKGRVAIVTGAAQGIGKAVAIKLCESGLKGITLLDIRPADEMQDTKNQVMTFGTEVIIVSGDASNSDVMRRAMNETMGKWGRLDVMVNNAGGAKATDLFSSSEENWDRTMNINLKSMFLGTKFAAEIMKDNGGGSIVNMASLAGVTGGNTGPEYASAKAGAIGLTKYASRSLGQYNIRVNALAPGSVNTEMIATVYSGMSGEEYIKERSKAVPLGRIAEPEEIAKIVLFLASDLSSYVTGDVIMVTGGRVV